jgi:hypothetical protein
MLFSRGIGSHPTLSAGERRLHHEHLNRFAVQPIHLAICSARISRR